MYVYMCTYNVVMTKVTKPLMFIGKMLVHDMVMHEPNIFTEPFSEQ